MIRHSIVVLTLFLCSPAIATDCHLLFHKDQSKGPVEVCKPALLEKCIKADEVGGILFQGTANPARDTLKVSHINFNSIDSELVVVVSGETARLKVRDWVLTSAARFADSQFTAAVSLTGGPNTQDEIDYLRRNPEAFLISYHPNLDDTVAGLFFAFADSMFVLKGQKPALYKMRTAVRKGLGQHLGTLFGDQIPEYNELKSKQAAEQLDAILQSNRNWASYMMHDLAANFTFDVANGRLILSGYPNFDFWRPGQEKEVIHNDEINNALIRNRALFYDLEPYVFPVVDQIAQLRAFFDYLKNNSPHIWQEFLSEIARIERDIPEIETPAAWKIPGS